MIYENFGSMDNQLVVDISALNSVVTAVDSTPTINLVTVGAGIRCGTLYTTLDASNLTFTGGVCPSVGLGGHLSAGGFGFLSRKWGLLADNVVAAKIVDAKGELLTVDDSTNTDLFWAIRGGGGAAYGIIVEVTLHVHPAPTVNTIATVTWTGYNDAPSSISAFQTFAPSATNNLASQILMGFGKTIFTARFLGTQADLQTLLQQSGLLSIGTPTVVYQSCTSLGAQAALWDSAANCSNTAILTTPVRLDATNKENSKAKSEYITSLLNSSSIQTLVSRASSIPSNNGFINIAAYGGAVSAVSASATPFPHRAGTLMQIEYAVFFDAGTVEALSSPRYQWINDTEAAFRPFVSGAHYGGYVDLDVDPSTYFGVPNWNRLVSIRKTYDAAGLFSNPQTPEQALSLVVTPANSTNATQSSPAAGSPGSGAAAGPSASSSASGTVKVSDAVREIFLLGGSWTQWLVALTCIIGGTLWSLNGQVVEL
ncbi:hypothetical protein HDU93_007399 [Gonapodya sp. JEL0774]|nr:hypothetical protein HDU93_007399 [Gonapodya sp. JEL0774]